ncbi:hypothetical protein C8R44DRAFT_888437 [Mycena epipterygia]|nr:hypothetical protein C8R44DRAFT_888437 [Mycena epipterygia]
MSYPLALPLRNDNVTIRFVTDNAGPWFLHCHIDFHLEIGLAIVFAEDTATVAKSVHPRKHSLFAPIPLRKLIAHRTAAWDTLCPTYDALTPDQL